MDQSIRPARGLFAFALIGLGIVGLIYGDFALTWQRIPIADLPGRAFFAYFTAMLEFMGGLTLLFSASLRFSVCLLFVFTALWAILLKVPAVVAVPGLEATWLGFGEIAVIWAGAWTLFAVHGGDFGLLTGERGIRYARVLFAVALPMIGLSHFFYADITAGFIPKWIPFPLAWVYIAGTGSLLACLGILCSVLPRLAAALEAAMLGVITLLVWGPGLFTQPTDRTQWTAFLISSLITLGAWLVADTYRDTSWLSVRQLPWKARHLEH